MRESLCSVIVNEGVGRAVVMSNTKAWLLHGSSNTCKMDDQSLNAAAAIGIATWQGDACEIALGNTM